MRTLLIISIVQCISTPSLAQLDPMFLTTLYFEDAIGNRDSIEIGYDTLVNTVYDYPAEEFGQIEFAEPFDPVFEVRAKASSVYAEAIPNQKWYKRVITRAHSLNSQYDCYRESAFVTFAIRAVHQPITVSWKKADFTDNFCHIGGFLAQHFAEQRYDGTGGSFWWQAFPEYLDSTSCLGIDTSWTTTLRNNHGGELIVQNAYVPSSSGGTDTLYTMNFYLSQERSFFSPCDVEFTSSIAESFSKKEYRLISNPVSRQANFLDGETHTYQILDIQGKVLLQGRSSSLNLTSLHTGMYILVSDKTVERFIVE